MTKILSGVLVAAVLAVGMPLSANASEYHSHHRHCKVVKKCFWKHGHKHCYVKRVCSRH